MRSWYRITNDERAFFIKIGDVYSNSTITAEMQASIVAEYRKNFPESIRTDKAIVSQVYACHKNPNPPPRRKYNKKIVNTSILATNVLNLSSDNEFENILIDLKDYVCKLELENLTLKNDVEKYKAIKELLKESGI